jgi:hypothetical protein
VLEAIREGSSKASGPSFAPLFSFGDLKLKVWLCARPLAVPPVGRVYRGPLDRLTGVSMRRLTARLALVVVLALAAPPAVDLVASLVGANLSDQAQASDCYKKAKKSDNKPLCPPPPPPPPPGG